jgi:hypothetical protein
MEGEAREAWPEAARVLRELVPAIGALAGDYPGTLEALRRNLNVNEDEQVALMLLSLLDPAFSEALIDRLVSASLSHRNALRIRWILGRLPRDQAESIVPPAVWRTLQETGDDDAYRRMAELLWHLGLREALSQLAAQALKSSDPDIREVGEDFSE